MDQQIVQLQQQIQRLQQEVSNISQVCNQLQQSEQANALQLQQMTQKEILASQGLKRIQQAAGQMSQEINQLSGIAQQIAGQVSPFQRNIHGAGVLGTTFTGLAGQTGMYAPQTGFVAGTIQPGTGILGGVQYGAFGQGIPAQYGFNPVQTPGAITAFTPGAYSTYIQPYTQGYSPLQFGTGGQPGYAAQAFSGFPGQQVSSSNLLNMMAPVMQSTLAGLQPGMQGTNPTTAFNQGSLYQAGTGIAGYSPYQSNLYGFR